MLRGPPLAHGVAGTPHGEYATTMVVERNDYSCRKSLHLAICGALGPPPPTPRGSLKVLYEPFSEGGLHL